MAVFKWAVNSQTGLGTPDYLAPANLIDLSTGSQGIAAPTTGDTTLVTAIANPAAYFLPNTKLLVFPVTSAYTHIDFFGQQGSTVAYETLLLDNSNALVGDTVQGETLYVDGTAGIPKLQLQNSHLVNDRLLFVGTDLLYSTVDSSVSGSILVGRPGQASFLEIETNPYDFLGAAPSDHVPVTMLNAAIDVGDGSTLWVTSPVVGGASPTTPDVAGLISNGTITVRPGAALAIEDQSDGNALTDHPKLAAISSEHGLLFGNGGSIDVEGAAGKTTKAVFECNTIGPGAISVEGNGAAPGATTLLVDGFMKDQAITVADATVTFYDTTSAIDLSSSSAGFDVSGGSFTFGDDKGVLVLNQAQLTSLEPSAAYSDFVQVPNGRHPFTTPISGFRAGDVIELPGKFPPQLVGMQTYLALYDPASHLLSIETPDLVAGRPPVIIAQLTFVGSYVASGFKLVGNPATNALELTYAGSVPSPIAAAPGLPQAGAIVSNATLNGVLAVAAGVAGAGAPVLYEVDGQSTLQTLTLGAGVELDIGFSDVGSLTGTGSISGVATPGGALPLVDNFGTLDVNGSIGTALHNDGLLRVGAGERLALNGMLASAGRVAIAAGGTLSLGGVQSAVQGAANDGTIDVTAGTLALTAAATGAGSIIVESGAMLDVSAARSVSNAIVLKSGATLVSSSTTTFTGPLTNENVGPASVPAPAGAPAGSGAAPGVSAPAALPVYRFFDRLHGTHFFTADGSERSATAALTSAYTEEANGFGAAARSDPDATAVYRFFDTRFGTHFFTASAAERDSVQAARPDLAYEAGSTFYEHASRHSGDVAVYRLFDQGSGTHFYTGDQAEYAAITTPGSAGYRGDLTSEGIEFYAPSGSFS